VDDRLTIVEFWLKCTIHVFDNCHFFCRYDNCLIFGKTEGHFFWSIIPEDGPKQTILLYISTTNDLYVKGTWSEGMRPTCLLMVHLMSVCLCHFVGKTVCLKHGWPNKGETWHAGLGMGKHAQVRLPINALGKLSVRRTNIRLTILGQKSFSRKVWRQIDIVSMLRRGQNPTISPLLKGKRIRPNRMFPMSCHLQRVQYVLIFNLGSSYPR